LHRLPWTRAFPDLAQRVGDNGYLGVDTDLGAEFLLALLQVVSACSVETRVFFEQWLATQRPAKGLFRL
jgi:hypothetical protein